MKKRKVGLMLLLFVVTIGVYWVVWHFKFQNELREESGKGILPVGHIMLLLFLPLGGLIYYVVWLCTVEKNLVLAGAPGKNRWWLHIILFLLVIGVIVSPLVLQGKANKIGTADAKKESEKASELRTNKYAKYQTAK